MDTVPAVSESEEAGGVAEAVVADPVVPVVRGATATTQLPTFTSSNEAFTVWSNLVLLVHVTAVWLSLDCTWMVFPSTAAIRPDAPGRLIPPPLPAPLLVPPPCPPAAWPADPWVICAPAPAESAAAEPSDDEPLHAASATAAATAIGAMVASRRIRRRVRDKLVFTVFPSGFGWSR